MEIYENLKQIDNSLMELFGCPEKQRTYYNIKIQPDDLFGENGKEKCMEFIEEYFQKGGKENVLIVPFKDRYTSDGKHFHTVSLFLLGLTMESLFSEPIKKSLQTYNIEKFDDWYRKPEFQYSWFLTCLYHDIASCIEKESAFTKTCCSYCPKDLDFLDGTLRELDNREYQSRFQKDTIVNYCRYRIDSDNKDHGILAGQMLYRKLIEAFKNVEKNYYSQNGVYYIGGLRWNREFIAHFAYVAEAIICHNMWTVSENDRKNAEKYRLYGLDELIIKDDSQKLTFDKHPLQFMLCMLDSIEPVKRFVSEKETDGSKVSAILEKVSIEQKENIITVSWTQKLKSMTGFWDWIKNIYDLSSWMNVTVSPCQCDHKNQICSLSITIKR